MNTWTANAYSQPSAICHPILIVRKSLTLLAMIFAAATCDAQQSHTPIPSLTRVRYSSAPVRSITIRGSTTSLTTVAATVACPIVIPGANHPSANDTAKRQPTTFAIEHGKVPIPLTSSHPLPIEIAPMTIEKYAVSKPSIARIDLAEPPERE